MSGVLIVQKGSVAIGLCCGMDLDGGAGVPFVLVDDVQCTVTLLMVYR